MNNTAKNHMNIVASLGCVICRRDHGVIAPAQVHHVAEGSGQRSHFMTAPLCQLHHLGELGIHGIGVKAFLRIHRLPSEYHLLELVNRYRAEDRV
jgi:Recombination enhancement, RecA-dependent nuclease